MGYKFKKFFKTFSLIELIIVIAIIAILGVTAFLILNNWIQKGNTAKVNSDILTIKKSLNISFISNGNLPKPGGVDKKIVMDASSNSLWYQGEFDEDVISKLGNINKVPLMKNNQKYLYSLSFSEKEYQIGGFVEKYVGQKLINNTYSQEQIAIIDGNYNGFIMSFSGDNSYIWNVPTMFLSSGSILQDNQELNVLEDKKSINNKVKVKATLINNLFNDNKFDDCIELDNFLLNYPDMSIDRQQAKDYIIKSANQKGVKINCGDSSGMVYLDLEKIKNSDFTKQENKDYLLSVLYSKIGYSKNWTNQCDTSKINIIEKSVGGNMSNIDFQSENTVYVLKDDTNDYIFSNSVLLGNCSSIVGVSKIKTNSDLGSNGLVKLAGNNVIDGVTIDNSSINSIGLNSNLVDNLTLIRTNVNNSKNNALQIKGGTNIYLDSINISQGNSYGIFVQDSSQIKIFSVNLSGNNGIYLSNVSNSQLLEVNVLGSLQDGIVLDGSMSNSLESLVISGSTLDGIKLINLSSLNTIYGTKTVYNGQWGVNMTNTCGNSIKSHISGMNSQTQNGGINNGDCNTLSALTDLGGIPIPGECGIASGSMFLNPEGIIESSRCELGVSEGIYATGDKIKWECNNEGAKASCEANRILVSNEENQISLNPNFICAVYTGGNEVRCWGYNYNGQLGNGNNLHSSVPVKVQGLTNVASINSDGGNHICAIKNDGTVWCWGDNQRGQLGNDSAIPSNIPVMAQGINNAKKVVANNGTTCALTTDKNIYCWGYGGYNMQGNVGGSQYKPILSYNGFAGTIKDFDLGTRHSCIATDLGEVNCVGYNNYGNLGLGTNSLQVTTITKVPTLSGIEQIIIGTHQNLAFKNDGTIRAWGDNNYGKLGIGIDSNVNIPTKISSESFVEVSSITNSSMGIKSNGDVYFWGSNLNNNQPGLNTKFSNLPLKSSLNTNAYKKIILGGNNLIKIKLDGSLEIIGYNSYGQLGNGNFEIKTLPINMKGVPENKIIGSYKTPGFYIDNNGKLFVRGTNETGELGNGTYTYSYDFIQPEVIKNLIITKAELRQNFFMALDSNGNLYAWGINDFGQIGNGEVNSLGINIPVKILSSVTDFSLSSYSACALKTDKTVWCWGRNNYGQIGSSTIPIGTSSIASSPVHVSTLTNIATIQCQNYSCFSLDQSGNLYGWGYNGHGQLGNSNTTRQQTPISILSNVRDFHLGTHQVYARKDDGSLWAWGRNDYGQIGNGATDNVLSPLKIMDSFYDFAYLNYANRECIIQDDKTLWCRGQNNAGQGGNGTVFDILSPQKVVGISNISQAFGNSGVTCVKDELNEYYCWGNQNYIYLYDN